jgi:hypothetical protein
MFATISLTLDVCEPYTEAGGSFRCKRGRVIILGTVIPLTIDPIAMPEVLGKLRMPSAATLGIYPLGGLPVVVSVTVVGSAFRSLPIDRDKVSVA